MVCQNPTCMNCGGQAVSVPVVDAKIFRAGKHLRFGEVFIIPVGMNEDGDRQSLFGFKTGAN